MATHLAAAYSHPLSSPTMHHSAVLSSSYTLQIPTQLDAVVALSYDQLTRNPAYVRAILLSYCRSKLERRNGQLEGGTGRAREEVGRKLDKLERVLVRQGFTTFSLPLLQTRTTLSLPLPDPSLPSASVDASAPSAPFTFSYTIVPSSSSSSSNPPSSSTRRHSSNSSSTLHSYPNGEAPTVRLRRSTTGAGSISSSASPAIFGNMDGIDRDRAAVVREEENEENEEAEESLPRYNAREGGLPTYSTRVGEGEAPRYARAAAASPSPAVAAAPVVEAEETRRRRERGREQFWWGVEGGAGGVA
ncbi:hypothetical protein BDY24DRAFT_445128 [Mrakia frigida]|uniref:uncharacterized protein n=1 Tax=Mrakia frigida TaxID=29902 RepID=UPI003FCC0183